MQRRDHAADAELPLETKPDVEADREQREHGRDHAGADQFATDTRANHLDPAILDTRTQRLAHQLHRLLLRRIATRLAGQPDQHVSRRTEPLQRWFPDMKRIQFLPHIGEVGRSWGYANLD